MATTINPAVSGVSYRRWVGHVGLYIAGVSSGAMLTYALTHALYAAVSSVAPPAGWLVVALPLVGLAALRDLGVHAPLPYPALRQVPEWLRQMLPPGATALAYGSQLGTGFLTRFTYSTHTAFVMILASQSSVWIVGPAVLAFALAKSVSVLTSLAGTSYPDFEKRILLRQRTSARAQQALRVANAAMAAVAAAVLIVNL